MSELSRDDAERLVRVEESVGRIEEKMNAFIDAQTAEKTETRGRLTALERWKWGSGAAVVAGAAYWAQPIVEALP